MEHCESVRVGDVPSTCKRVDARASIFSYLGLACNYA